MAMNSDTLTIYEILKKAFAEDEAKRIVTYMENADTAKLKRKVKEESGNLPTKEDVQKNSDRITALQADMHKGHANLIKWMFIFWIGNLASVIVIIKFLM